MICIIRLFTFFVLLCANVFPQEIDSLSVKSPKKAAIYGSVFPGGGQLYNEKWLKAALILSLEGAAIYRWSVNADIYNHYKDNNYPLSKHRYLEKRNKYAWWIAFIYIYGMVDAVVDAHLMPFEKVMNENLEKPEPEIDREVE